MKNVLLITIDCFRKDHLTLRFSPNIYRLKKEGLSFEDIITHSTRTDMALPSMFASVFPWEVIKVSLPLVLRKYGYTTAVINTNPQLFEYKVKKLLKDFDIIKTKMPKSIILFKKMVGLRVTEMLKRYLEKTKLYKYFLKIYGSIWKKVEEISSNKLSFADAKITNKLAINLLRYHLKEPFFLWVHYMDLHCPYLPPGWILKDKISEEEKERLNSKIIKYNYLDNLNIEDLIKIKKLYEGSVLYVDYRIKELLAFVRKGKYADNTVIIITADHGEEFLDHGGLQHCVQLYEEVVRVPFVIYGGSKRGEIKGQRGLINLAPTILDILGLPKEISFKGRSFFEGEDEEIIMMKDNGLLGIRTNEWKYIYPDELYNLKEDPYEKNNLIGRYPEIEKHFKKRIEKYKNISFTFFKSWHSLSQEKATQEEEIIKERLKTLGYL